MVSVRWQLVSCVLDVVPSTCLPSNNHDDNIMTGRSSPYHCFATLSILTFSTVYIGPDTIHIRCHEPSDDRRVHTTHIHIDSDIKTNLIVVHLIV